MRRGEGLEGCRLQAKVSMKVLFRRWSLVHFQKQGNDLHSARCVSTFRVISLFNREIYPMGLNLEYVYFKEIGVNYVATIRLNGIKTTCFASKHYVSQVPP